jgi:arylsulfatase A-like enzyme
VILADDLGVMDVSPFRRDTFYETPNIERLAREGVRLTQAYTASPVCSPTRYSLLTGRYPTRAAATDWFVGKRAGRFLPAELVDRMPLEEVTLAEALRAGGYRTAHVGKWHLGPEESHGPTAQGFEINVAGTEAGSPKSYFSPYGNSHLPDGPTGEYLTTRLGDEAIRIIERWKDEPFFLFLSLYAVHAPLQAPKDLVDKYTAKAAALDSGASFAEEEQVWPDATAPRQVRVRQNHAVYAAMVESMDTQVGRVLDALDRQGLAHGTVVMFLSDNGGLSTAEGSPTSNLPLRGGKGWVYEGGIRTPLLVRWPGGAPAGSSVDTPVTTMDLYPTLLQIAGLPLRPEQHRDGEGLVNVLGRKGTPARDALFWHYPHYSNQGGFPGGAVRVGAHKLIERYEDGRVHLYDLDADPGEREDLAAARPEVTARLRERLHAWYGEVGARFLRDKPGGPTAWRP